MILRFYFEKQRYICPKIQRDGSAEEPLIGARWWLKQLSAFCGFASQRNFRISSASVLCNQTADFIETGGMGGACSISLFSICASLSNQSSPAE